MIRRGDGMDKFTIHKGKKYKLTGKCLQCGKCCIGNVTYITKVNDDTKESIVESVELSNPTFDTCISFCPWLNMKTRLCAKHDEKTTMCSEYPRLYQELELFPDCGYKWEFVCNTDDPDTVLDDIFNDKKYQH